MRPLQADFQICKDGLLQIKQNLKVVHERKAAKSEELNKTLQMADRVKYDWDHAERASSKYQGKYLENLDALNQQQADIDKIIESQQVPRVISSRSIETIDSELRRLTARIREKEKEYF